MLLSVKFSVIYQQETIIMTMKLPIILSTMIAALAIPGTFASQADAAAPDAAMAAPEAAAPEAPAEAAAPAKPKKTRRHHQGKHHGHKHHHHHHHDNCNTSHDHHHAYKGTYDDMKLRAADGDVNADLSPKAGPMEEPGHKMP